MNYIKLDTFQEKLKVVHNPIVLDAHPSNALAYDLDGGRGSHGLSAKERHKRRSQGVRRASNYVDGVRTSSTWYFPRGQSIA